ncbi:MAG: 50S ribosomal protein L5 [Candidatus Gracilibacteria bacterium]
MAQLLTLREKFSKNILPELQKELKVKNFNAVPRIKMVKLNVGIGKLTGMGKDYSHVVENLAAVSGQKPMVAKARIAISNFKLKKGQPVGVYVTLRGERMYDFLNKLVNVVFPRVRDFRGISPRSFDGRGNYTVAIKESTVFPEVNPDDLSKIHGIEVTVVTSAKNNEDGFKLLKSIGFPFQEVKKRQAKKA